MKTLFATLLALLFGGCVAPIQPTLWQPRPQSLILKDMLVFEAKGIGQFILPAGEYMPAGENKFGYFYSAGEREIRLVTKLAFGGVKEEQFKGGIVLSNRERSVIVYELTTIAAGIKKVGDLATLAAWESGDKDGVLRPFRGRIPDDTASKVQLISR